MTTYSVSKNQLILILGATGTGKSKLAIELAQSLEKQPLSTRGTVYGGAEIVNADAMQLYRGLPIITNKVTAVEQQGISHHLLDHIGLEEEPWTVQKYIKEADQVIEDIRGRGKLPIVVGGTSYYIYSLLFRNALLEEGSREDGSLNNDNTAAGHGRDAAQTWPILEAGTKEIYATLQEVDPEMARRWHPNDRRKIQRSLEIYLRSGRKASEMYEEQRQRAGQALTVTTKSDDEALPIDTSDLLRYDPIIFWLEAEDKLLKDRLNQRVNSMLKNGLLDEAAQLHSFVQHRQEQGHPVDKTKGIWVSIGYKEVEPWIEALKENNGKEEMCGALKNSCVEAVKASTRQYAKRQNRFIRIRLANALNGANASHKLFLLDCSNQDQWTQNVSDPAFKVLQLHLAGELLPNPSDFSQLALDTFANMFDDAATKEHGARKCESCRKTLMTEKEWVKHINSRSHKKIMEGIRRREPSDARRTNGPSTDQAGPG